MKRPVARLVSLAVVGGSIAAVTASLAPMTACTTETCEGATTYFTGGEMLDDDTWESSPVGGTWMHYSPELNINVQLPTLYGRTYADSTAYISPVPRPNDPVPNGDAPNNFATASGNLAEFQSVYNVPAGTKNPDGGADLPAFFGITLHNDTCADYYVRIVVHFADEPAVDAGTIDASSSDAGLDGSGGSALSDGATP